MADSVANRGIIAQAFVGALNPKGMAAEVFAQELHAALPWLADAQAQISADDIFTRRRAEQQAFADGMPQPVVTEELPDGKLQELVESLAQPREGVDAASADALIHIYANLRAQRDLHAALADRVFAPGGKFEQAITTSLLSEAPGLNRDEAAAAAAGFVRIRRSRAQAVVNALRPDGPVEKQAIELAGHLRRQTADPIAGHSKSRLGEDIAFGIQQTFACWATDFIDPYVGKWFQDKFKSDHHHGTLAHTWGGEVIGDSAAFFAFLGVRQFLPQSVDWLKRAALKGGDKFYDRLGKKSIAIWAAENNIIEDSQLYKTKLAEWKDFQADNFAKSSVISVSSVVLNVATQKAMGNTHTLPVITASKLTGAAITMAAMLGLRFLIPKATKQLDDELSERYFNPVIRKTQKWFGVGDTEDQEQKPMGRYTARLRGGDEQEKNKASFKSTV